MQKNIHVYDHTHAHECGFEHGRRFHAEDGMDPAVCSVQTEKTMNDRETFAWYTAKLEKIIRGVTAAAESNNWLIGHIKAYIRTKEEELWLSSVGADIARQTGRSGADQPGGACAIGLTAIVFGPDEGVLYDAVQGLFDFHSL